MAKNWRDQLPADARATNRFPRVVDADGLELHDVRVVGASAALADVYERPELVNVALESCDIAGFVGRDGRGSRVLVEDSRLRGASWIAGLVQDAALERVTGSDVSFRFSTLRRVVLRECVIDRLDLSEVTLDDVRLEHCVLRGANLHRAKVSRLRIEHCDLTGCTGAEALAGASVHPDDILALGPSLADALGLTIEESD